MRHTLLLLIGVFTCAGLLTGCDAVGTTAPFQTLESAPIALYGVLREDQSTQAVRVEMRRRSVDVPASPEAALLENVEVTSQLVEGGPIYQWKQQPSLLNDGSYASTFVSEQPVVRRNRYRVTVREIAEDDTLAASYTVQIPTPGDIFLQRLVALPGNGTSDPTVEARFGWRQDDPSRFDRVDIEHIVCLLSPGGAVLGPRTVPLPPTTTTATDDGLTFTADLREVRLALGEVEGVDESTLVRYEFAQIVVRVRNAGWEDGAGTAGGEVAGAEAGFLGAGATLRGDAFPQFDTPPLGDSPLEPIGFLEGTGEPCR